MRRPAFLCEAGKMRSAFDIAMSTATGRKARGTVAITKTTTKTA
jgi:hypothetical protein